tara:strand:+ start:21457 stop:21858 length:402 start_codon:yes stop_codon:yes gene_type:complete
MPQYKVDLVKYDTVKTKKRKRENLIVEAKSEVAVIAKLERIHKGDKVQEVFEIVWGEEIIKPPQMGDRLVGTVKFFSEEKGYGFIKPDVDMKDLFFHASALGGQNVYDKERVEFEASEGPKGPIAIHIKLLDD